MSGSVNKAILVGNLGRDPDVRHSNDGKQIVSFSIATSDTWTDKATGERKERTEWHNVVVFNEQLAKIAAEFLKKGAKVYVEGKVQTRDYDDKDGNKRKVTEVVLQQYRGALTLLDRADRPAPSPDDYGHTRTVDRSTARQPQQPLDDPRLAMGTTYDDTDIPF